MHDSVTTATRMLCGLWVCIAAFGSGPVWAQTRPSGAWNAIAPPVRCLLVDGNTCWASGDAGLILRSDDAGRTWRRMRAPADAHFQGMAKAGESVYFFGGNAAVGQVEGAGRGAIFRTDDGGQSFERMPVPAAGWLYGGAFGEQAGIVYGQAAPTCLGGVWRSAVRGKRWSPLPTETAGHLLGGDFHGFGLGYLVGDAHRIISVRRMRQPRLHPPELQTILSLRAARFADANVCWAAGENGSLLRSTTGQRPWTRIRTPIPRGLTLLADFEAIATAPDGQVWAAGGQIGVIPHSADGGRTWKLLPAPGPGAVHAIAHLSGNALVAAGDAGRIWRSADGGKSWKLVRGGERTDVLFVLGAADRTLYPAIVAHALAGTEVAVVYATRPRPSRRYPPDQPLRAAAVAAGARGVMVLSDFTSQVAGHTTAPGLTDKQVLKAWSDELDVPAEPELLRQLAAAIRLYRPAVVVVGPDGSGPVGPRAENRLVARIVRKAADLAGRNDAQPALSKAGLKPWTVKRVFVGIEDNETWISPWQPRRQQFLSDSAVVIDSAVFPAGTGTSIEMLAQAAVWRLPWTALLDRSPRMTGYERRGAGKNRRTLFTAGIVPAKLRTASITAGQKELADMSQLRFASAGGRTAAALASLAAIAQKQDDPRSVALAADRILLVWARLSAEGDLIRARETLLHFLKIGGGHPLYRRINVAALADSISAERIAQARHQGPVGPGEPKDYGPVLKRFAKWTAWSERAPGRMLHARGLLATGRGPQAVEILKALAAGTYPAAWRHRAEVELKMVGDRPRMPPMPTLAKAHVSAKKGKLDGLLDEDVWSKARRHRLRRWGKRPAKGPAITGSLQVVRSPTHALFGVRLDRVTGRVWTVRLCIDSDRDAWTQLVLSCDTLGDRRATLVRRFGPPATADRRTWTVKGQKGEDQFTLEIAVPLALTGTDQAAGGLWNFQLVAEAKDYGKGATLYFHPQPDPRLLPERYGAIFLPPWK